MTDLFRLVTTEPESQVMTRTQGWRLQIRLELTDGPISGVFGPLDERLFVTQVNEGGITEFVRVAEPSDLANGQGDLVSDLDLYFTDRTYSEELLGCLVADVEKLLSVHRSTKVCAEETA